MEDAAEANYRLGLCFQQMAQHEEALAYFKEFLRLCSAAGDKVTRRRHRPALQPSSTIDRYDCRYSEPASSMRLDS